MQTGENEQGLRKVLDMTRLISIVVLALHFYYYCFRAFEAWDLTMQITTRLLTNAQRTGLFDSFVYSKLITLGFLITSLIGAKGSRDEKLTYHTAFGYLVVGLLFFFGTYLVCI